MSTRCLTVIYNDDARRTNQKDEIVVMYRQMDGYPEGHGKELEKFLDGFTIVNGLGASQTVKVANGMGCLAAQIVAHFKNGPGQFYLHPAGTRDCGEEYVYHVQSKNGIPVIKVEKT